MAGTGPIGAERGRRNKEGRLPTTMWPINATDTCREVEGEGGVRLSFLLWLDAANDEVLNLGDPFNVYRIFGELARLTNGHDDGWEELFSVPQFGEQQVGPEWARKMGQQARRILAECCDQVSDVAAVGPDRPGRCHQVDDGSPPEKSG
jgi:hypothetical protein